MLHDNRLHNLRMAKNVTILHWERGHSRHFGTVYNLIFKSLLKKNVCAIVASQCQRSEFVGQGQARTAWAYAWSYSTITSCKNIRPPPPLPVSPSKVTTFHELAHACLTVSLARRLPLHRLQHRISSFRGRGDRVKNKKHEHVELVFLIRGK